ncbi:MAG: hypothetical protein EA340_07770 [Nitriliruptor sp.]|nr:MAG: hypothetical protein EA340_07770 [Nitriliruptor sp.]
MADRQAPTGPDGAPMPDHRATDELEDVSMAGTSQATADRLDETRAQLLERMEEAREVLAARAKTGSTELASWAKDTGSDLAERAGPVIAERSEQARDDLARRWHDLEEDLPVDVETVVPQVQRGLWQVVRAALGVLLLLPKLLVRGLGGLGSLAEDVSERGLVAGERAREVAAAVPPSKRERRRRCLRTAAWTGAGFGVGLCVGWLVGRRQEEMVTYEPAELGAHLETAPVPPGPVAAPLDSTEEPPAVTDEVAEADADDGADADDDEAGTEDEEPR